MICFPDFEHRFLNTLLLLSDEVLSRLVVQLQDLAPDVARETKPQELIKVKMFLG